MLHDPIPPSQATTGRPRHCVHRSRRPWLPLLSALMELAQGKAELLHHTERAWASATFAGSRHTVLLTFAGPEAVIAAEALIEALPDHEFALPGQIVAEAAICSVEQTMLPEPRLVAESTEPAGSPSAFAEVRPDGPGLQLRPGVQEPRLEGNQAGPYSSDDEFTVLVAGGLRPLWAVVHSHGLAQRGNLPHG